MGSAVTVIAVGVLLSLAAMVRDADGPELLFATIACLLPSNIREECGADLVAHFCVAWQERESGRWTWLVGELSVLSISVVVEQLRCATERGRSRNGS